MTPHPFRLALALPLLLSLAGGSSAHAQSPAPAAAAPPPAVAPAPSPDAEPAAPALPPTVERGAWAFHFENDLFVDVDRNYTNGVQLAYVTPDFAVLSRRLGWFGGIHNWIRDRLPSWRSSPKTQMRAGFSVGQLMFTPRDYSLAVPDPTDRPYAGWLYAGFSGLVFDEQSAGRIEVQIGLVGPASLAEQAQKFVHSVRSLNMPQGWDYQLRNELAFLISYEHQRRLFRWIGHGDLGLESFAHAGATVGTLRTHAALGGQFRFGWRLPTDFGGSIIRPASDTFVPAADDPPASLTGFVGFEGRAVARDLFLDGNTFRDSRSVDREDFVGDVSLGASLGFRDWKVTYTVVFRSREFTTQPVGHRFASLTFSRLY